MFLSEIVRRFPSLELLDSEPVVKIAFDVPQASTSVSIPSEPTATKFPCEMRPSFITGIDGAYVANFLSR